MWWVHRWQSNHRYLPLSGMFGQPFELPHEVGIHKHRGRVSLWPEHPKGLQLTFLWHTLWWWLWWRCRLITQSVNKDSSSILIIMATTKKMFINWREFEEQADKLVSLSQRSWSWRSFNVSDNNWINPIMSCWSKVLTWDEWLDSRAWLANDIRDSLMFVVEAVRWWWWLSYSSLIFMTFTPSSSRVIFVSWVSFCVLRGEESGLVRPWMACRRRRMHLQEDSLETLCSWMWRKLTTFEDALLLLLLILLLENRRNRRSSSWEKTAEPEAETSREAETSLPPPSTQNGLFRVESLVIRVQYRFRIWRETSLLEDWDTVAKFRWL